MNSCDTPGLMPLAQALETMLAQISVISETEIVMLEQAVGRVSASAIYSPMNVPPAANSSMDGYAVRTKDATPNTVLQLAGKALAGSPYTGEIQPNQAIRITTGGVIPEGADAVIMQENTELNDNEVRILDKVKPGDNIRCAGEDIKQGDRILEAGTLLSAAHIALMASVGIAHLEVVRKAKVAIMATGDELVMPGKPLPTGSIYESNRYALLGKLSIMPVDVIDLGIIKDDPDALRQAFIQADAHADLVISCGGVSVGDADYVKQILDEVGQINLWKVAIKPGKPFAFGKLNHASFCGLPGNPVSSYVTFEKLVLPLLRKVCGAQQAESPYFYAQLTQDVQKRPGRADFQRGVYWLNENGEIMAKALPRQSSGVMSSVTQANCYLILEQDSGDKQAGQRVKIQPFNAMFSH
ncbi:molybdopterin molybdotransferase MoeA [Neptunicella marina]|uniref:Molybdopterin molybdenumtransferase n=1 Tax=Neptunicella marina TaxID=2125989 RepID=A0A8J6ITG4_9ALTE|nr:molybdopterin molybdotransferase MoeA [Neptunicella marina]MBC3765281.1 molybdopterin molybdotransferase MoeA [Neptunicella marina]